MSIRESWQEEKRSAYLYGLIAGREQDPIRKQLFVELAGVANKQARIWEKKWKEDGNTTPLVFNIDLRTRIVSFLLNIFAINQIRFILSAMKVRGMSIYAGAPTSHAVVSHLENRHRGLTTAGNLRAAVFGVNDGLVSNMSLLLGIVGASANHQYIVLSGIAGLLAGASSMAAGEYVSMRSQREFFEYQIELEKEELELYPEEEADELAYIYQARGLSKEEAHRLAKALISNPKTALDTLAREELGLNPDELGSPLGAAVSSFVAFAIGAFIPLLPYVFGEKGTNLTLSLICTGSALVIVGAVLSLYTNRSAILGSLRMLFIASLAGGLTFTIGKLLGTILY